jgi:hypothetical protein
MMKKCSEDRENELSRLRDFYDKMSDEGLTAKKHYDIPLIDTVGRTIYRGPYNTSRDRDPLQRYNVDLRPFSRDRDPLQGTPLSIP